MAEEFYAESAGICGGNWWGSPRNAMFPGFGFSSPCFVDVSNFYLPADSLKSRRIHDDYSCGDSPGFSAWDYQFPVTSPGNGFFPSALSDPNQTQFSDGEKVAEINRYASILSEFSGEVSSTLISDLYGSGGITAGNFNDQTQPVSAEDHFSNMDGLSDPSLPKFRSNLKPSRVNKSRPSNKSATTDSINARASSVYSPAQQRPGSKVSSVFEQRIPAPRDVKSSTKRSTNMVESMLKRPRIETPSPLPTFKVRKEKLGDRITALQQLVSPFGKTDTASVLHEAIDYIKFLHNQVHVLSAPRGFSDICGGFPRRELRSRGLCLVPISSTFPVASETPVDFWSPKTLGGTNFR